MPSVRFVFGYPLRLAAAWLAALALPGVQAVGCGLTDGVVEVFVDAPCAGAGMLYGMLLLAAGVGLVFRFGPWRVACLLGGGLLLALWANASRAALLFAGYAGILPFSPLTRYESVVGLFYFTAGGLLLIAAARWMSGKNVGVQTQRNCKTSSRTAVLFLTTCVFVGFTSGLFLFFPDSRYAPTELPSDVPVLWPSSWEGRPLSEVQASPEAALFWRDFPGACREFAFQSEDGLITTENRLVLRFVREATRQLHPAEDCFRGAGYKIKLLPFALNGDGRRWSVFTAEKAGSRWMVRQCVISVPDGDLRRAEETTGRSWPDVSAWYWDAARPASRTPPAALAVTVILSQPNVHGAK
jgi:exosortase/archaeosortase family protein